MATDRLPELSGTETLDAPISRPVKRYSSGSGGRTDPMGGTGSDASGHPASIAEAGVLNMSPRRDRSTSLVESFGLPQANGSFLRHLGQSDSATSRDGSLEVRAAKSSIGKNLLEGSTGDLSRHFVSKYKASRATATAETSDFSRKFRGTDHMAEVDFRQLCWRRQMVPVVFLLIATVIAAVASYWALVQAERRIEDLQFSDKSLLQATRLQWELDFVLSQVNVTSVWLSLRSHWRSEATRKQFSIFTQTVIDLANGMRGLTWVPIITDPSDREMLELQADRQLSAVIGKPIGPGAGDSGRPSDNLRGIFGGGSYRPAEGTGGPWDVSPRHRACDPVWDGQCSVSNAFIPLNRTDHALYPVFFLQPIRGNENAMLFDLSSNPARNASISTSILRNGFSTTARLLLVQETGSSYGFITFIPVYHDLPCAPYNDFTKLCPTLTGLANAVFRITDLVMSSRSLDSGNLMRGDEYPWDDFLLDFGCDVNASDGWVGSRMFLPETDCEALGNYTSTSPEVDELYSSANDTASAPNVQRYLQEILPEICRVMRLEGKDKEIAKHKTTGYSVKGESSLGFYLVYSFFVGDRRWGYIVFSKDFAYRASDASRAGPIVVLLVALILGLTFFLGLVYFLIRRDQAQAVSRELIKQEETTMHLLHNIFPASYVPRVLKGDTSIAERYDNVTIIFSDIVGFTEFASHCPPKLVVQVLNIMYSIFDDITEQNDVFKVETIGDGYMISSGCPLMTDRNISRAAETALDMLSAMSTIRELLLGLELMEHNEKAKEWAATCQIRIGMHTGSVVASVAGKRNPRFHLFGDTVNTASRMESHGNPGRIQMSETTRNLLVDATGYMIHLRGTCQIKGKGLMNLYYLIGRAPQPPSPGGKGRAPEPPSPGRQGGTGGLLTPCSQSEDSAGVTIPAGVGATGGGDEPS